MVVNKKELVVRYNAETGGATVTDEAGREATKLEYTDLILIIKGEKHPVLSISEESVIRVNPCTLKIIGGRPFIVCT